MWCHFVLFLLTFVLSVLLRFTDSDYPFFKLFFCLLFQKHIYIIKDEVSTGTELLECNYEL